MTNRTNIDQRAFEIHQQMAAKPDRIREFATRLTRRKLEGGERLESGQTESTLQLAATWLARHDLQRRSKTPDNELVDRLFDALDALETGSWSSKRGR